MLAFSCVAATMGTLAIICIRPITRGGRVMLFSKRHRPRSIQRLKEARAMQVEFSSKKGHHQYLTINKCWGPSQIEARVKWHSCPPPSGWACIGLSLRRTLGLIECENLNDWWSDGLSPFPFRVIIVSPSEQRCYFETGYRAVSFYLLTKLFYPDHKTRILFLPSWHKLELIIFKNILIPYSV